MRSIALALALLPVAAHADPHPMSSGATPTPTTETKVEMVDEVLTIDMDPKFAAVKAAITLHDAGPATELAVGFPCSTGDEAGQIDVPCSVPLDITVRGKAVKATKKTVGKQSNWVWTMKLAADETVPLVVAYKAPLVNDRYTVPASGMGLFTYRLTTGARWAGPIKKLAITVNHMHEALLFVSPAGYKREPGRLTWTLTDYEPTEEVIVMPHPSEGYRLAASAGAKTAAEARAKLLAGDFPKATVEQILGTLRRKDDWLEDWLKTITRLGGVPAPTIERARATLGETIKALEDLAKQAKR